MRRKALPLLALATTLFLGAAGGLAQEAKEINFGVISTESTQNLRSIWNPFLQDMEERTGLRVNAFFAPDYAGIIEGMRFDKVQVAWFGNKSAMEAIDRASGQIFAQSVDVEGNPGYWSVLIVPKDSQLSSLQDVLACEKNLDFGIGDPNSTSGFLVPTTFIFAENDINPKECFETVRSANHETNAMAVANQQVDVATNNTENMRRLRETNPEAYAKIKEIWRSPLIPSDPLVWREDLERDLKEKIYYFVLSYGRLGTPEQVRKEREILAGLGWAPFQPSSDAQLYPIRKMELHKQIMSLQADSRLAKDEKASQISKLKAQISKVSELQEQLPGM
jgi:phosphonate transport system substrate-binding protein